MTEFNLSKKIMGFTKLPNDEFVGQLEIEDVKEFIRLLKELIQKHMDEEPPKCFIGEDTLEMIDKLAGEKLI